MPTGRGDDGKKDVAGGRGERGQDAPFDVGQFVDAEAARLAHKWTAWKEEP